MSNIFHKGTHDPLLEGGLETVVIEKNGLKIGSKPISSGMVDKF